MTVDTGKKLKLGRTLQLKNPFSQLLMLTMLILILYCVLMEIFFSLPFTQSHLSAAGLGSRHRQFEVQVARLERLVAERGPVDCIFLGNSMTWLGVNPLVVEQAFEAKTGRPIRCFNFGVSALPASSAGMIAPVLVEKFHPKLLIFGTFARDYAIPSDAEDASVISDTPWLKYQQGEFNFAGWLYNNSNAFRYKTQAHDFLFMKFDDVFNQDFGPPDYLAYGFDPKLDIRVDVTQPADRNERANKDPQIWLSDYKILDENIEGLKQILNQSDRGVQVIVIEMPVYKTADQFFSNGESDYNRYVDAVDQVTSFSGTPFWRVSEQVVIPLDGWWDYFHLNIKGAQMYSHWLGSRLGEELLQGTLQLQSPPLE